ncbi:MAG TPA: hypothetical protein VJW75_03330 [Candidatus Eisenbacteria bacterium]|nr:hypothetical protein [Candidatus Eisenbacteria bacterium]
MTGARSDCPIVMDVEADPAMPSESTAVNVTTYEPAAVIGTGQKNVPSAFEALVVNVAPCGNGLPTKVSELMDPVAENAVTVNVSVHPGRL